MAVKIWEFQAQQSLGQIQQSLDLVLRNQASKMKGALGGSFVFAGNGSVMSRQHEWYRISVFTYLHGTYASVLKCIFRCNSVMLSCPSEGGFIRCPCEAFAKAILLGSRCFWYSLASAGGNAALRAGSSGMVSVPMSGYNTRHDESVWMNIGQNALSSADYHLIIQSKNIQN